MTHRKPAAAALAMMTVLGASAAAAADRGVEGTIEDSWIDGSVETAFLLNRHLNNFAIDTDVNGGVVTLTGTVESDIDRDLAGEIARGVDGVTKVDNRLTVEPASADEPSVADDARETARDFGQWARDATTTAEVKTRLLANDNTEGLEINVTTRSDVVELSGTVKSEQEADLAEQIAENVDGVAQVQNELTVASK